MDLDPTLRGGLELGLKICPVKTSIDDAGNGVTLSSFTADIS